MLPDPIRPVTDAAVNTIADKVGNLVGTLWDYSLGVVVNVIFLSRKADEVAEEMGKLQSLRDDLKHKAEAEARQNQANVSNQLERWVSRVSSLAEDAAKFQSSFDGGSTCITRFRLGYDVVELLKQARKLAEEGNLFPGGAPLTCPRGPDPVEQVPSETTRFTLVGGREALQQVEGYIMDDGVGIIGIYGMGGVGKTTTLKIINNEFLRGETCRDKFDVAIWVTVSQDVQISSIRNCIAGRLGLPSNTSKDELFRHLSNKRFILLLDDVWRKLDLVETGIPLPQTMNHSGKILFTTRYEQVCGEMDADQMVKIISLDDESSWELFRLKLGRGAAVLDNNPSIRQLAEEVVRRCGGLPIALVTVGRAMSNAKTAYEWKDAIRKLDQCAAELSPGMEEVLKSLKFSFEMLKDEAHRNCLLYCALFPEDYKISKKEIIDMWICEGFLDAEDFDEDNIEDTRCRGNVLISELQKACLLEEGSNDSTVMLHDTVRDMALWIAGHDFVVLAGFNLSSSQLVPKPSIWGNAKRISLMQYRNSELLSSELPSSFPNLTTLLLQYCSCGDKFLRSVTSTPALRVLVLHTTDQRYPIEITSFTSLQYLCFTWNYVNTIPVELGNLTNLRILHLGYGTTVRSIPAEAISRLSHLQVLNMSAYDFDDFNTRRHQQQLEHPQQLELSDLANLKRLSELYLPVLCSWASLGVIAASPVLRRSTRNLDIWVSSVSQPPPPPSSPPTGDTISMHIGMLSDLRSLHLEANLYDPVMGELQLYPISRLHQNLERLHIQHFKEAKFSINNISCHGWEPLFSRLRELCINNCDGCSELTWVGRLPCLEKLDLIDLKGLREVIMPLVGVGSHDDHPMMPSLFPKLKSLNLTSLPMLRSISTGTLLFPCLKWLYVDGRPRLQRLSFGPESPKNSRKLMIDICDWCSELTWAGWLPCLETLEVRGCEGLREVMLPLDGGGSHDHHPIVPSSFPKLKHMYLEDLPSLRSISTGTLLFPCLERLFVHECPRLQRLPFGPQSAKNLRTLKIYRCDECSDLTWVGRLPCLEELLVGGSEWLREVMMLLDGGGSHDHHPIMPSSFPKLKIMYLLDLPSLRSSGTSTLLFPCLERLYVYECPQLQRLPFGPQSANNLQSIHGHKAWWDGLEWDDDAHQQSFSSKFREWDAAAIEKYWGF